MIGRWRFFPGWKLLDRLPFSGFGAQSTGLGLGKVTGLV